MHYAMKKRRHSTEENDVGYDISLCDLLIDPLKPSDERVKKLLDAKSRFLTKSGSAIQLNISQRQAVATVICDDHFQNGYFLIQGPRE